MDSDDEEFPSTCRISLGMAKTTIKAEPATDISDWTRDEKLRVCLGLLDQNMRQVSWNHVHRHGFSQSINIGKKKLYEARVYQRNRPGRTAAINAELENLIWHLTAQIQNKVAYYHFQYPARFSEGDARAMIRSETDKRANAQLLESKATGQAREQRPKHFQSEQRILASSTAAVPGIVNYLPPYMDEGGRTIRNLLRKAMQESRSIPRKRPTAPPSLGNPNATTARQDARLATKKPAVATAEQMKPAAKRKTYDAEEDKDDDEPVVVKQERCANIVEPAMGSPRTSTAAGPMLAIAERNKKRARLVLRQEEMALEQREIDLLKKQLEVRKELMEVDEGA